jgi:hypothetical protein
MAISNPRFCFPAIKQGVILDYESEKQLSLNELDARKPLVVSASKRSEEPRLHNLV